MNEVYISAGTKTDIGKPMVENQTDNYLLWRHGNVMMSLFPRVKDFTNQKIAVEVENVQDFALSITSDHSTLCGIRAILDLLPTLM